MRLGADTTDDGTPACVASCRTPPRWLRAGDTVGIEFDGVGAIESHAIDEPGEGAATE